MSKDYTKSPYIALTFQNFRFFLISKIFLTLGIQIQTVVVGWSIYELTKDPLSLGLIGLFEIIPNFSITLFGGHFADIYNRKKIVLSSLLVLIVASFSMYFFAHNLQNVSTQFAVWGFYFLVCVTGFCRGLLGPSMFSLMTECVPKDHYVNSTTWHSILWQLSFMLGAGSSGFIFTYAKEKSFLLIGTIFIFSFFAFCLIENFPNKKFEKIHHSIFQSIKSGIDFVFGEQVFLGAISLDLFAVLFGGAVALLPIFANEILMVGPEGLGFLKASPAIGSFAMAILLIYCPPKKHLGKLLHGAVFGFGLCMIGFSLSTNFILSLVLLFFSGAFDNISVVIRGTIMQTLTPMEMKGRVSAVNSIFIGSSNELGALESGIAAKVLGTAPSVLFGGIMTLCVVGVTWFSLPKLRKLDELKSLLT